jgi:tRNA G37 N-methylase Trm5
MVRELVRPGTTVWDIGANVGLFSFAAASLGAQVVAVEADIWLANLMQRSAQLNKLPVNSRQPSPTVREFPGYTFLLTDDLPTR